MTASSAFEERTDERILSPKIYLKLPDLGFAFRAALNAEAWKSRVRLQRSPHPPALPSLVKLNC